MTLNYVIIDIIIGRLVLLKTGFEKVQTDTESSSPSNVELNSATEISTDSEFDHDPIVREAPRIFIDDTHIKKPTKVQVKQGIVTSSPTHKLTHNNNNMNNGKNQPAPIIIKELPQLEFKPLVQVDPSLLNSNRLPLKNPRAGDYLLNKTPSTEGIASKKSLELKKRYLLGEQGIGNGIMKSGSTSILDSKLKNFNSYISECQKLLNPGADISPSMKSFLDKTKIGDNNSSKICSSNSNNSASNLTVMKNSVNESDKKDSEKENMFVNSRNELNKSATSASILTTINNSTNVGSNGGSGGGSGNGVGGNSGEYSETVNTALVENISKSVTTQKVKSPILETIDLISPEKSSVPLIDLTKIDIPSEMIKSNQNFIKNIEMEMENDKIIDLTADTPPIKDKLSEKNEKKIIDEKPDVSKDVKEVIPDIITHIENVKNEKHLQHKLSEKNLYSHNEEKDQNHKQQKDNDIQETCIEVPNIPWNNKTKNESDMESDSLSSSSTTSSLEDIPHYILDSTTSPDTQNLIGIEQIVPRLEVHDSSGALMQIDSLMIIDGKYVGDPEDIKLLDIPEGTKIDFPISHSEIQKKGEQKEIKEKKQKEEEGKENEKEEIDVNETDEKLSSSDKESTPTNKPKLIPKFDSATVTQIHQMEEIVDDDKLMIVSTRPNLKFDSKNENKIDTLKNIPLIMEKDDKMKVIKPTTLDLGKSKVINTSTIYSSDKDKTPIAERTVSDSETEVTGQVLTETELSDWTADDAVSENFVDIEFALNSNKGTIKRNKRAKKKSPSPSSKGKIPSSFISIQQQQQKNQQNQQQQQQRKQRENAQTSQTPQTPTKDCGIFRNLDIDEIEFMDTGSEGSYAETYSATNRAMLMNRGYIKFIENNTNDMSDNYRGDKNSHIRSDLNDTMSASGKEVCGVDYIEQGACILSNDYDLKTPVNEIFPTFSSKQQSQVISSSGQQQQSQQSSIDVANDIDEDSLQYLTSQGTTDLYTTTTEESEALTVVTSPLESAPKMSLPDNTVTTTSPTSSSDKNDKTTSSTTASSKIPIKKSSSSEREQRRSEERSKQSSKEDLLGMNNNKNKEMDEMSYEEYVRKLQLKITQISNARDSIDVRKQKRKSSKSEVGTVGSIGVSEGTQNNNSVIENKNLSIFEPNRSLTTMTVMPSITASSSSISVQQNQKVPEIPTLSRKLEEITKERTKQKDLIHDLVMDKLQSKKQLNAEKRLNRSRNRSIFCPGSMSPSPSKVAISSSGCSNSPHYHIPSSSERRNSKEMLDIQQQEQQLQQQKENVYSKTKFSPKDNKQIIQMFSNSPRLKQRPLSDNFETATNLIFDQTPKITKTQSFCIYTPRNSPFTQGDKMKIEQFAIDNTSFATPLPPPRANRKYDETLSASREKLRAEARARARLKSNEELGLSPEEKLQMLRRRYHLDMHEITSSSVATTPIASVSPSNLLSIIESSNKSDDNKLRERKMVTSKSVNDITAVQVNLNSDENLNDGESSRELIDFTSDPNLSSQQEKPIKCHRRKDPERRKSLIQTVSSFFNKKKDKDSSPQSPAKEKSSDSVFSRFKISPKSKEKSKDKDLIASGDIQGIISNNNTYSPSLTTKDATYSSSPQLFKRQEDVVSPPPIPPLPTNYQRSDDESYTTESRDQKKQRAISKASRQAELKRLRIAQEIQREQEEIEVKLKELEAKGVLIEKTLRGEDENIENLDSSTIGASDEKLFKELLGIWRNITQLKKRDEELAIQQQELQLEHRHAQLREELDMRLSCSKLDKSSADVAAEGAILNEMLEIVAKRAALRPTETVGTASNTASVSQQQQQQLQSNENDDSDI